MSDQLRKPDLCPSCGGTDIKQIMYGLPTEETMERAQRGEVVLGGCSMWEDMADWRCSTCQHEWFDPTDPVRIEREELMDSIKLRIDEQKRRRNG
jgi:hypothetical protein